MSICGYPRFLHCSQNVNFLRQFDIEVMYCKSRMTIGKTLLSKLTTKRNARNQKTKHLLVNASTAVNFVIYLVEHKSFSNNLSVNLSCSGHLSEAH